jgi:RTX toxin transport system membrane fusion protein
MVLNKDVGFVLPGQYVTGKSDAFPFTSCGTIDGEVTDVSRDANNDDEFGLIYPVRAGLDQPDTQVDGKRVPIAPAWRSMRRSSRATGA